MVHSERTCALVHQIIQYSNTRRTYRRIIYGLGRQRTLTQYTECTMYISNHNERTQKSIKYLIIKSEKSAIFPVFISIKRKKKIKYVIK